MVHRIKAADARAIAKSLPTPFTGDENDLNAVKTFIADSGRVVKGSDGETINWKTAMIEADEPLVIKTVSSTAALQTITAPDTNDLATIVKSAVDDATKGLRERPNFNGATDPNLQVSVKSVEESIWECSPKHFRDFKTADRFRDYFLGGVLGKTAQFANEPSVVAARKRWNDSPITKAYGSNTQAGGGALTFMEFIPDLIQNVLQYGVSRKLAQVWPMSQEQAVIPKMTGIHTLTYPQQNATATQSTGVSYSNVTLNAKTGICIVKLAKQLVQDANIMVLDNVMQQIARTVAYTEDVELLTANGQPEFGGCVGVNARFAGISSTLVAGGAVSGGTAATAFASTTMTMITALLGVLPDYARNGAVWVCNPVFLGTLARLGQAQGGVTFQETMQYGYVPMFLGKPVLTSNVLSAAPSTQYTPYLLYGDFKRGAVIGDRFGLELDATDIRYWDDFAVGVRGVIRHDVNVHDVGDATNAGPICCLFSS